LSYLLAQACKKLIANNKTKEIPNKTTPITVAPE
jgi:hypothetical protein